MMNDLKSLVRPVWGRVLLLSGLTLCNSVLQVALALLMRYVIDSAVYQNGKLIFWGSILIADLAAMVALNCAVNWLAGSTTDRFSADLRSKIIRCAVYSNAIRAKGYHSGQLLSRGMEDVRAICDGVVHALPSLIGQVTRLLSAFGAVFLLERRLAYILAAVAVVVIFGVGVVRSVMKVYHRRVRQSDEKLLSVMQEDLQQLELIQSLQIQPKILARFSDCTKDNLTIKAKRRVLHVSMNSITNICTLSGTGVLLLWGAWQVSAGALSYGSLTAMLQLISMFRGPVLGLSGLWTRLTAVEVAAERLEGFLQAPKPAEKTQIGFVKAVVFENVTFTYPGDDTPVLRDFSVTLPVANWSCLTGMSGKGKSTIFKLILGLHTPDTGRVYLETAAGEVTCSENTRHLFAYVPQDYALFSGTIRENLSLVADADLSKRKWALSLAQADFVWDLAAGEQTLVGENNTGLSKGQLQRIAIARAVLMDRPVLLLDECTSALDSQTEEQVLRALYTLGKQAILVTHRPAVIQQLPQITQVKMND